VPKPDPRWYMLDLPLVPEPRGNLTYIEGGQHIPFEISRVYYLYDVPGGATRAGHAHRALRQLIIAASGSFTVHLDDGSRMESISLNRSYQGLLVDSMVWRVIDNFSSGAICLVLASDHFSESDYYREYNDFIAETKKL
jgi:hypothetical protein